MTQFNDSDVQRGEDTVVHRNKMKVTSPDSGKTYTISQRTSDLVWCCSCWAWRGCQPAPCKHLRALGLVSGRDEPSQVVLDRIGELRWAVQQVRAKVDGAPRPRKVSNKRENALRPTETPKRRESQASRQSTAQKSNKAQKSDFAQNRPVSAPEAGRVRFVAPDEKTALRANTAQRTGSRDIERALVIAIASDALVETADKLSEINLTGEELAVLLSRFLGRLREGK